MKKKKKKIMMMIKKLINDDQKAEYYELMKLGNVKKYTDEKIAGLRKLFDNDETIDKSLTKLKLESYLTKTYKTNFAITKLPKK